MRNPNILATCKECGGRLHTYDILHSYNQDTRFKQCKKCGREYRTIEVYESRYEMLMGRKEEMVDLDEYLDGNKPYQEIIDKVTFDETICVAMGIPIHCNREEMIVRAIIHRLYEYEQTKEQDDYSEGNNDAVERCLSVLCENCDKADECSATCYIYDEMASLKE